MAENSIRIFIDGGLSPVRDACSSYYLITIEADGGIGRTRQHALENEDSEDFAHETVMAGAMIYAAEQTLRTLEKEFPDIDVRGKAQEVYEDLQRQDEEGETEDRS